MDPDEAVAELVAQAGQRLLRVGYHLSRDRGRAEDLLQGALVQVIGSLRRRDLRPEDWYAYLRRAVVNEYLRTRRLRSSGELVLSAQAVSALPAGIVPGPEDVITDRAMLWAALGALSNRQRTVLVLRYYEDLADNEIASILGCREVTVRSLASRGLGALRAAMDPARGSKEHIR
jgi:RNA polymerase sigma factor (sigma-70 family)